MYAKYVSSARPRFFCANLEDALMLSENIIKKFVVLLVWACLCGVSVSSGVSAETEKPRAIGQLTWDGTETIQLEGPWQIIRQKIARPNQFDALYRGETAVLPDHWSQPTNKMSQQTKWPAGFGVASYRMHISVPDDGRRFSLLVEQVYSSYEVWVNGKKLASKGRISETPEGAEAVYISSLIRLPQTSELDIILIAANFEHGYGGISNVPSLGLTDVLESKRKLAQIYYMTLFGIFGGLLLFHFAYFASSYTTGWQSAHLWYGLSIILFVSRLAFLREIPFELAGQHFEVNLKALEFFVVYLMAPVWLSFFATMFPDEFPPKIQVLMYLPSVPFIYSTLFLPLYITTSILNYSLVLTFLLVVYQLVLSARAWQHKRAGAAAILISTFVYFCTVINDSLIYALRIDPDTRWNGELMPFGFIIVAVGYSIALSKKSNSVYRRSFELAKNLSALNETLEERVSQRTTEAHEARLEAEKSAKEKTNFLSSASHDLRQPINALSIYNQTLTETAAGDKNILDIAGHQHTIIGSMMKMLETMLDAARLEANLQTATMVDVPLAGLFQALKGTLTPIAAKNNVTLKVLPCSLHVLADEKHLHRVLSNLVINAINASAGKKVILGARRGETHVDILVADSGKGISAKDQGRIFDRFQRLDNNSSGTSGFGLGLSIVTELCALMDMEVGLKSSLGRGTVFKITAVRSKPQAAPVQLIKEPARVQKGKARLVILVVDDNEEVQNAMVLMLRGWGHSARGLGSLRAVEDTLEDFGRPDFILTDYRLSKTTTGFDVIRAVQALYLGVPAAVITGATAPEDLKTLAECPWPIFHKPLDPEKIRDYLAENFG